MLHSSASRQRAAAAVAASGPAPARRRPHPAEQLERLSSRLDELIRDVRLGAGSHRQYERHVAEAEDVATALRAVFRAPTPSEQVHPPLWQQGGKAAW